MKNKPVVLAVILTAAVILIVFGYNSALASTGCFTDTNGHWAETFICWMKDNGITSGTSPGIYSPESNVTRAQMAVFMQKLDELAVAQASSADATNLTTAKAYTDTSLSTGDFYFNAGPSQWQPHTFSTAGYIELYTIRARLRGTAGGYEYFVLNPTLPAAIYGHKMYLDGVKICYDASANAGRLFYVELGHYAGGPPPTLYNNVTDSTMRGDKICRVYSMAHTGSIWGSDVIFLYIGVSLPSAADYVDIFNVTFITHVVSDPGVLSAGEMETREPMPGLSPSLLDGSEGNP